MAELQQLSKTWDVLIVGAGPAGASAAISCARLGLSVLLVDAKRFPRRKVCGGCLNQVSVRLLQQLLGRQHLVWHSALPLDSFQLNHRQRQFKFRMPAGWAIERSLMDHSLVEAAQAAGVTFAAPLTAQLSKIDGDHRIVELTQGGQSQDVVASVVILASGLGNRSACELEELQQTASPKSRVGIEAIFHRFPAEYCSGTIHMVVARDGYVGLTQIADQRLHVAAAVDRAALQRLGPEGLAQTILREAGAPALLDDENATWRGTPPLTACPQRRAAPRVFLIGDAAGYVEPFTGEGIRWALETGVGVAEFAARAKAGWEPASSMAWENWYERKILREQRLCRRIAFGLKQPQTRWLAHQALRVTPRLASMIIARLNSEST